MRLPFSFEIPRSVSLAFSLTLIGVSVFLLIDMFGLGDNSDKAVVQSRQSAVETLAMSLSTLATQKKP